MQCYICFFVFQVHTAAPMVDTRAPPTYMHLHLKLKKLQVSNWPFAKFRTCGSPCDFLTSFHCDVIIAQLFDGPFDCDVIMKKSAKRCTFGPLAIRQLTWVHCINIYIIQRCIIWAHLEEVNIGLISTLTGKKNPMIESVYPKSLTDCGLIY